jgi:hypothetical protein
MGLLPGMAEAIFVGGQIFVSTLVISAGRPHHCEVFNKTKGGDPMSSGFGFQSVARADCPFGKQPS